MIKLSRPWRTVSSGARDRIVDPAPKRFLSVFPPEIRRGEREREKKRRTTISLGQSPFGSRLGNVFGLVRVRLAVGFIHLIFHDGVDRWASSAINRRLIFIMESFILKHRISSRVGLMALFEGYNASGDGIGWPPAGRGVFCTPLFGLSLCLHEKPDGLF